MSTVSIESIGPREAQKILGNNTHNRNVRAHHVDHLAAVMTEGGWSEDNGETIKIGADGVLLDGQHRLLAIVRSGVELDMLVVRGLEPFTQESLDRGARRTFGDVLKLRGESMPNDLAATLRLVVVWESGVRSAILFVGGGAQHLPSDRQMLDLLDRRPDLRECTADAKRLSREIPVLTGRVLSLLLYLTRDLDSDDSDFFFDRLASQSNVGEGEPIYELHHALRRRESSLGGSGAATSMYYALAIAVKAWNAYRLGATVSLLKFRPGGASPELFPELI